jgi:hypothetical protein
MMTSDIHEGTSSPRQIHRGAGTRSLWLRLAQSVFAVLCVVVASLAGSASASSSSLHVGAPSDKAPSIDTPRDYGRNLLRPNAEVAPERTSWRAINASGSGPDPNPGIVLPAWQDSIWLLEGEEGSPFNSERGPAWLTVRAGCSRAPPTAIGRSRTAA